MFALWMGQGRPLGIVGLWLSDVHHGWRDDAGSRGGYRSQDLEAVDLKTGK